MPKKPDSSGDGSAGQSEVYELRLFVNGTSPISMRAISNLREVLESTIPGRYRLEIVDAHQQPVLVTSEDVAAIPTLIRSRPLPRRRLIGDMSDKVKVLKGLGLEFI
ncbi:MAG: circadian clock protein KaiB [Chitinophagaceae bacterium]|nr:MAG: circadian clock protein KaiB [Chitinophagaceae bacterium]